LRARNLLLLREGIIPDLERSRDVAFALREFSDALRVAIQSDDYQLPNRPDIHREENGRRNNFQGAALAYVFKEPISTASVPPG
jgi:hypothetical protein